VTGSTFLVRYQSWLCESLGLYTHCVNLFMTHYGDIATLCSLNDRYGPVKDLRLKGWSPGSRTWMYPYVAPHTAKIHTLITLGVRHRAKPHVFKVRTRRPCGLDSHRPLHFFAHPMPAFPWQPILRSYVSRACSAHNYKAQASQAPLGEVRQMRADQPPVSPRSREHHSG
jgi:hypothetical protein